MAARYPGAVLEHVTVTSYLAPLREGGSLPGLVEADNLGTYVLKFRGAGQGPLALVAEIIGGELARRLGFRTPELALADLDPRIAKSEPDQEIQDLLKASAGINLAVDYLPGSAGFDPLGWTADEDFASELLWFDALIQNVDRTWRNPNLLVWHNDIWLIDHGAALYFHHDWPRAAPDKPFDARQHVVKERAKRLAEAHERLAPKITAELLAEVTGDVPPEWFGERGADAYVAQLLNRAPLVPEVIRLMTEIFEYALIRVVPRIERGESVNAGVIVYSKTYKFLKTRIELNEARLTALDPGAGPAGDQGGAARLRARLLRGTARRADPWRTVPLADRAALRDRPAGAGARRRDKPTRPPTWTAYSHAGRQLVTAGRAVRFSARTRSLFNLAAARPC